MKKKIPKTQEFLPTIGLGTWQTMDILEKSSEFSKIKDVWKEFINSGGGLVDSSPMYGKAEKIVGKLIDQTENKSNIFTATKVWTRGKEAGIQQIESSFQKFGTKVIDLFQIHNLLDTDIHIHTLQKLKDQGRIRYIGLTHYTSSAYHDMEKACLKHKPDFIQIPYSVTSRKAEERILPFAHDNQIAVLVNRPFEEGNLFSSTKDKTIPVYFKQWNCESFAQIFLKYIISHPAVTTAIPATSKIQHLIDNLAAGFEPIPQGKERVEFMKNTLECLNLKSTLLLVLVLIF